MTSQPPTPPILPAGPPTRPPVYKRWWFIVLAVVFGLGFLANLSADNSGVESTGTATSSTASPVATTEAEAATSTTAVATTTTSPSTTTTAEFVPGIGDPVVDGQFEFVVTDFECGFDKLGDGLFEVVPNGQYCILSITVENVGDSPRFYSFDSQKLIDTEERLISSDFGGSFALDSDNASSELNPGVGIETSVAFDVSENATETTFAFARLHDSILSFGAEVALNRS